MVGLQVGLACGVLLLPGFWGQQLQRPGSWAPNLHMRLRLLRVIYICEILVLFHRGENKQMADEIHSSCYLNLSKHKIVSKQHRTFFEPS